MAVNELTILTENANKQSINGTRFVSNVTSNISVFLVTTFLGAWFIPYLIQHLGVSVYGLVPLSTTMTNYLSLITLSINGGVGRFLTIDIEKNDNVTANKTFNTSLFGSLVISVFLLVIGSIFIYFMPHLLNIPIGEEVNASLLFIGTLGAFLTTTIGSGFAVSSWARNRFDLRNYFQIGNQIIRVGIVVLLFLATKPTVWFVGLGIFLSALFSFGGDVFLWRKLTPQLRIHISSFDRTRVRQLFSMGGWMVVNQLGTLLFLNIDLLVVNTMIGAEAGGKYGSILIFSTMLRSLASTISGVLTPSMVSMYASNSIKRVIEYTNQSIKFLGIAMALPVGLLCGLSGPFLALWLGPDFRSLSLLLSVMLLHLPINLSVLPLFGLQIAYKKVKWPGVVTLSMGMLNLITAVSFVKFTQLGMLGVAVAGAIVLTLKNAIYTPIYAAKFQQQPWWCYLKSMLPGLLGFTLVSLTGNVLGRFVNSWIELVIWGLSISIAYILITFIVLNPEEKSIVLRMIKLRNLQ